MGMLDDLGGRDNDGEREGRGEVAAEDEEDDLSKDSMTLC
jgi:hypothetical protein